MDIVVPIHNAVNERVWQQVLEWERHALGLKEGEDTGVKLVSFMGRPKEMSPRARWKSFIGSVLATYLFSSRRVFADRRGET